ncbi:hypothetical protein [Chromobacterium vaccinii]|uniref:hypothetical protein n=1 Tax=Chromobacterium vaccinii TaxID=1108595 RepID=UPI0011871425|nr:hypothetical protein [Chromobacterium vaccinii]
MSSEKKVERGVSNLVFPWVQALGTHEGLEQSSEVLTKAVVKVYVSAPSGCGDGMAVKMLSELVNNINTEIELLLSTAGENDKPKAHSR